MPEQTFNKAGVNVGDVRWFSTRLYLPYTASEKFEWAHGGSNAFTDIMDLHPDSGTAWPAFSLSMYPTTGNRNQWAYFRVYGGEYPSTQYATRDQALEDHRRHRVAGSCRITIAGST